MVSVAKLEKGIASFLDAEIMPKLPADGIERVLTGTVASLMIKKSMKSLTDNKALKMLGVQDDKGDIDVDTLAEEFKKNIQKDGFRVDIPVIGCMVFHESDVDTLLKHINSQ